MKLQNEKIIFLRNNSESWEIFQEQDGVQALPKYESFIMIPEGKIGTKVDYRVIPSLRTEKNQADASRWATHYAIISRFLKSNKEYMFVCEDTIELLENKISIIENLIEKNTIILLADSKNPSQAYILDRDIAKIIQQNAYIYYTTWDKMLYDMKDLGLINLKNTPILSKYNSLNKYWYEYLFLIVLVLFMLFIFNMLCPFNGFALYRNCLTDKSCNVSCTEG
jgi:hypothetical protein